MYNVYITSLSFKGEKKKKTKSRAGHAASHSFLTSRWKEENGNTQVMGTKKNLDAHTSPQCCPYNPKGHKSAPPFPPHRKNAANLFSPLHVTLLRRFSHK